MLLCFKKSLHIEVINLKFQSSQIYILNLLLVFDKKMDSLKNTIKNLENTSNHIYSISSLTFNTSYVMIVIKRNSYNQEINKKKTNEKEIAIFAGCNI